VSEKLNTIPQSSSGDDSNRSRRRPRYRGTHPRRFDERYKELQPDAFPEMQEHIRAQGRTPAGTHVPILVDDVMATLNPGPGAVVVDCTVGYGGHAVEFLKRIAPNGVLVGLDIDGAQLERTATRLKSLGISLRSGAEDTAPEQWHARVVLHRSHFAGVGKVLSREGLTAADVIFADLGLSSMQVDDPARGFSYKFDGPLDMRMDDRLKRTAAELIATMPERELSEALRELSDEPDHERIVRLIVQRRATEPITRTKQLVRLIFEAKRISQRAWRARATAQEQWHNTNQSTTDNRQSTIPPTAQEQWHNTGGTADEFVHPAARTFQALRMLVNDEAAGLEQFLRVAPHCLKPHGRIGVLSFHSGEDRRVKHAFRDGLRSGFYDAVSDDVIRPTPAEIASNPRARSAKLRWASRAAT